MRVAAWITVLILIGMWAPKATADEIDRLIHAAASGSPQERLQALKALGDSGDLRALQPLLVALRDDNTTIRAGAIAALQVLARTLKGLYRMVARWIEELLLVLGGSSSPPLERTHHLRHT
jgi:HEAT repeat protein